MTRRITAQTLDEWLHDGAELALFDIREKGQIGEGHLFWSVPLPYSRLEVDLPRLAPNPTVRTVLVGDDDDVTALAAKRAVALGYRKLATLDGGIAAWTASGRPLFKGVNVPSKTFGEFVEHAFATPSISPEDLAKRLAAGDDIVVIDGRPVEEYRKMNIPGSRCCPNGELPFRIRPMVPDPATTVVINCAGRTRSIMGTELLRSIGLPNPVMALRDGTMGWQLAGLTLEHGGDRLYPAGAEGAALDDLKGRARNLAVREGVYRLSADQAISWLADPARTTFLLDVRTAEDYAQDHLASAQHAPGGQLIQATDQFVGVKRTRLLLLDDEGERAPAVAAWLARAGWETAVLKDGKRVWGELATHTGDRIARPQPALPAIGLGDFRRLPADTIILDIRSSFAFRNLHIRGARWSIRPRLRAFLSACPRNSPIVLITPDHAIASLAAIDIEEAGYSSPKLLADSPETWEGAGLATEATEALPSDAEAIDYLFFVHDRHNGNLDAARQYLVWETGLIDQLDSRDRDWFLSRFG
jgi:rhodanese-related sulfurtransferase